MTNISTCQILTLDPTYRSKKLTYTYSKFASNTNGFNKLSTAGIVRAMDWDKIELEVDAHVFGEGIVQLPMINLKPIDDQPCQFNVFELEKLKHELEAEIGVTIGDKYEFVYTRGGMSYAFYRKGGYQIALKRFAEAGGDENNILRLLIRFRTPQMKSATIEPQQSAVTSKITADRTIAKSRHAGVDSDLSNSMAPPGRQRVNAPTSKQIEAECNEAQKERLPTATSEKQSIPKGSPPKQQAELSLSVDDEPVDRSTKNVYGFRAMQSDDDSDYELSGPTKKRKPRKQAVDFDDEELVQEKAIRAKAEKSLVTTTARKRLILTRFDDWD